MNGDGTGTDQEEERGGTHQCAVSFGNVSSGMGACVWWSNEGREGKGRCRFGDFGGLEILSVVLIVLLVV